MLEPFVFLAILALYIEFPAVQDLIYTKICLQVLTAHDFSIAPSPPVSLNQQLPSNGRIQGSSAQVIELDVTTNLTLTTANDFTELGIVNNSSSILSLCSRVNKNAVPRELRQEILDINSLFWLKYQLIVCMLGALFTPYWGGISDKIGRLIPLNVPIASSMIWNIISLTFGVLISIGYQDSFHIDWLYCGAVIVGLSGGQAVLISNSFSYLSDNTSSEDRSKRVAILESVIFLGHSLGFFLSKYMMLMGLGSGLMGHVWDNRHFVAFGSCALLNLLCLLYSSCRLRHRKFHRFLNNFEREQQESGAIGYDNQALGTSPKMNHRTLSDLSTKGERLRELTASTPDDLDGPVARADQSNWTLAGTLLTFKYYKDTYLAAMKPRDSRPIILMSLLATFLSALSLAALMSLFFIYVKMEPFNWTTSLYSDWNSTSSITRGTALICLTLCMKLYSGWNVPDPLVAALGFLSKASGLLLIGLAQHSSHLYWSLICFSLSEYAMPPIRSLLSKLVNKEELCKIYSCIGALQSICFVLGNVAFYVAFNYALARMDYYRMAFIITAGLEVGAMAIMLIVYTSLRHRTLTI